MGIINLDRWLVERVYEPFAWCAEYYLKLNCFVLAVFANGLYVIASLTMMKLQGEDPLFFAPLFGFGWITLSAIVMKLGRSVMQNPEFMNPWKPKWYLRMSLLCVAALLVVPHLHKASALILLTDVAASLGLVSVFYFASCNPMPSTWNRQSVSGRSH